VAQAFRGFVLLYCRKRDRVRTGWWDGRRAPHTRYSGCALAALLTLVWFTDGHGLVGGFLGRCVRFVAALRAAFIAFLPAHNRSDSFAYRTTAWCSFSAPCRRAGWDPNGFETLFAALNRAAFTLHTTFCKPWYVYEQTFPAPPRCAWRGAVRWLRNCRAWFASGAAGCNLQRLPARTFPGCNALPFIPPVAPLVLRCHAFTFLQVHY